MDLLKFLEGLKNDPNRIDNVIQFSMWLDKKRPVNRD
jgi:hypothetical protein